MATLSTPALPRDKCARFDIPLGHNLQNIDQLILEATKDEEIKELKDQKRRLRNKKAAFDSRIRKKEHVEALERGIKCYVERNHELEEENKTLQMHLNNSMMKNEELLLHNDQLSREIEALKAKRNHLMVQQSDFSAATLPAQNSDEFSQWVMDTNGWGELLMIDGFGMDSDQRLASSVV